MNAKLLKRNKPSRRSKLQKRSQPTKSCFIKTLKISSVCQIQTSLSTHPFKWGTKKRNFTTKLKSNTVKIVVKPRSEEANARIAIKNWKWEISNNLTLKWCLTRLKPLQASLPYQQVSIHCLLKEYALPKKTKKCLLSAAAAVLPHWNASLKSSKTIPTRPSSSELFSTKLLLPTTCLPTTTPKPLITFTPTWSQD